MFLYSKRESVLVDLSLSDIVLVMNPSRISEYFSSYEFDGLEPDPLLLYFLGELRTAVDAPVDIISAGRDPVAHVRVYKAKEAAGLIPTKGNGLGDKELIDVIPWGSKHLPTFSTRYLRAVDLQCRDKEGGYLDGEDVFFIIRGIIESERFKYVAKCLKYEDRHVAVGIGKKGVHVDVGRYEQAVWRYS